MTQDTDLFLMPLVPKVLECGGLVREIYGGDFAVMKKADSSVVTKADFAVDAVLYDALRDHFPDIPVISEERFEAGMTAGGAPRYFLVDPIDGTREFVNKTGEFTVNIGLIEDEQPVAGIVYAPISGRLFVADLEGGAFEMAGDGARRKLSVREVGDGALKAVASRSHLTPETQDFLSENAIENCVNAGSSLKFCLLAAGEADIYPRFGPTMEWDTAAGHAILAAAGGQVLRTDGKPLTYGKPGLRNPDFIACSRQAGQRCSL